MRVLSLVLLAVAALHSLRMADANCQRNNDEVVSFTPGGVIEEELPRVPDDAKRSWPELEGKRFEEAKAVSKVVPVVSSPSRGAHANWQPSHAGGRGAGAHQLVSCQELQCQAPGAHDNITHDLRPCHLRPQVIQAEAPDVQVIKVPEGSMVTMDYRESRVRVFVKDADVVVTAPSRG